MYICAYVYLDWEKTIKIKITENNKLTWKLTETNSNLKEKIKH